MELLVDGLEFLEAPRVDAEGALHFADIRQGGVYRLTADGALTRLMPHRDSIGGIAFNEDGRIITSSLGGLMLFDPATGEEEILFDRLEGEPVGAVNDMAPDGNGGIYAGLVDSHAKRLKTREAWANAEAQPLAYIHPGHAPRRVGEAIMVSNGIAISPDGTKLYQCDTPRGVLAYDRKSDGSLANQRLLIDSPNSDGMAVDVEGGLWVANVIRAAIDRFTPEGQLDHTIEIPVPHVTSLTFGGPDLRDLYVVTGSAVATANYPLMGRVYRLRSPIAGVWIPQTRF